MLHTSFYFFVGPSCCHLLQKLLPILDFKDNLVEQILQLLVLLRGHVLEALLLSQQHGAGVDSILLFVVLHGIASDSLVVFVSKSSSVINRLVYGHLNLFPHLPLLLKGCF